MCSFRTIENIPKRGHFWPSPGYNRVKDAYFDILSCSHIKEKFTDWLRFNRSNFSSVSCFQVDSYLRPMLLANRRSFQIILKALVKITVLTYSSISFGKRKPLLFLARRRSYVSFQNQQNASTKDYSCKLYLNSLKYWTLLNFGIFIDIILTNQGVKFSIKDDSSFESYKIFWKRNIFNDRTSLFKN